jgi:hypothetical protein
VTDGAELLEICILKERHFIDFQVIMDILQVLNNIYPAANEKDFSQTRVSSQ